MFIFSLLSGSAFADLPVAIIYQSSLPYNMSPSNYDNSPSNYNNSISNYDNSLSNYDNSESNYDNNASNYDNGPNGDRRLLYKDGGSMRFAGYYVAAANGITNFYSPRGKRMFYNPKNGLGVFGGKDGSFCGVLAHMNGELSLVLTERGAKIFFMSE